MSNVTKIDFGALADRQRAELADALAAVAENIRRGEIEHLPHGWVLLLHSDTNPRQFEVLNKGLRTKADMDAAQRAMRHHIATTLRPTTRMSGPKQRETTMTDEPGKPAVAGPLNVPVGRVDPERADAEMMTFPAHRDQTAEDIDAVIELLKKLAATVRDGDVRAFERWWIDGGTEEGDAEVAKIRELLAARYFWRSEKCA